MSIGYSAPSGKVRAALQDAYDHGIVLVASAGNSGDNDEQHTRSGDHGWAPVSFPAEYPGVLSVGAVNMDKQPTSFSSGNLSVKVAAPGETVPAQGRNGLFYTVNGTSPACALVAGVAALIKSKYPSITPAQVTEALTATAQQPMRGGGYNVLTGFGIVNADAALIQAGKLAGAPRPASDLAVDALRRRRGGDPGRPGDPARPRPADHVRAAGRPLAGGRGRRPDGAAAQDAPAWMTSSTTTPPGCSTWSTRSRPVR